MDEKRFEQFVRGEISEASYLGKKEPGVFEIGDRVIGTSIVDGVNIAGLHGVVAIITKANRLGITFDKQRTKFHNLDGAIKRGHGWWVSKFHIKHE